MQSNWYSNLIQKTTIRSKKQLLVQIDTQIVAKSQMVQERNPVSFSLVFITREKLGNRKEEGKTVWIVFQAGKR